MLLKEIWDDEDNKKVMGTPDSIYVSLTEEYEVRHFIEQFLKDVGRSLSDTNKQAVLDAINSFPGSAPILRSALRAHVTKAVKWLASTPKP